MRNPTIGGLGIYLVSNAKIWDGAVNDTNRFLDLWFTGADWDALFYDVLHCPEPQPDVDGEDIEVHEENVQREFEQSIPEYPMLARISDMYKDAAFEEMEIISLREECLKIRSQTANVRALESLDKLLVVSDQAIAKGKGLFFASD